MLACTEALSVDPLNREYKMLNQVERAGQDVVGVKTFQPNSSSGKLPLVNLVHVDNIEGAVHDGNEGIHKDHNIE